MRNAGFIASVVAAIAFGGCSKGGGNTPDATTPSKAVKPPAPPAKSLPPPGPPLRSAKRVEVEATIKKLEEWVKAGATDPTNPWALAHGLVAFGKDLKASDGRLAIDVIVSDFAQRETVAGRKVWGFAAKTKDGIPLEPHADLMLKSIVGTGVKLDRSFVIKKKKVTLKQLVDDAAWAFELPKKDREWHDFAWSMSLFLDAYGKDGTIKTQSGDMTIASLTQKSVQQLEDEQAFLLTKQLKNEPHKVTKERQGIFGHTCGGLHFVQGSFQAAALSDKSDAKHRAKKQLEIVDFRWDAERRLYRRTIRDQPRYRFLLHIQELKFHGHILETNVLAAKQGLIAADEQRSLFVKQVAADLIDAVAELKPLYETQEQLRKTAPQQFYDLVGDGCHAIRGLRGSLDYFFVDSGGSK